jgi:hypothetical protein
VQLQHPGKLYMVRHLMPAALAPLILFGFLAMWRRTGSIGMERWVLFSGMAVGAVSYFMQEKGLTYHRYAFVFFMLLWVGWELSEAMHRDDAASRAFAVAGVAALFLVVVPYYVNIMRVDASKKVNRSPLAFALQGDLGALGGDKLQRQVLCLDLINGCFDALYRSRLEQNTGATGDLLLFSPATNFAQEYYRHWFMERQQADPANVVVVENEWYQKGSPSFDKLNAWPEYAAELRKDYVPVIERDFGTDAASPAYRIYLRKGSDVLAREIAHPLQ